MPAAVTGTGTATRAGPDHSGLPGSPRAQPPGHVRLPDGARVHVDRREPTAAGTIRVDALKEAEVKDLAGFLGRVAHNGYFAGPVRHGTRRIGHAPGQNDRRLLVERDIGKEPRV